MNMNNLVCRTCLGIISEGKVSYNVDDENGLIRNVRNIRDMIMFCVPEMDMYVSISPVICESCLGVLVNVYNFKIRCLRVENAVRSYIFTNNVMDSSCVNLNNVVRQQIVEALKQKQWPQDLINEYVDKHLCVAKSTQAKPTLQIFQAMTQKFKAPRTLNTSGTRPSLPNVPEVPTLVPLGGNITHPVVSTNSAPSPYEGLHDLRSAVGKNLMPSSTLLAQRLRGIGSLNCPPISSVDMVLPEPVVQSSAVQSPALQSPAAVGAMQNLFLNALQLTSKESGGREEAVLLNNEPKKKNPRKSKTTRPSQNFIPLRSGPMRSFSSLSSRESLVNINGMSMEPSVLCPTTGLLQPLNQPRSKETCLRSVRKNMNKPLSGRKINSASSVRHKNDDVIVLDDDADLSTPKVGEEETLLMNFDENVDVLADSEVVDTPASTNDTTSTPTQFNKQVIIKLAMIDKETMKRKLTPEDVIDEILSKRRKVVVKLSSRLPYLHKNKKLTVKVSRDKFFWCMFCTFVVTEGRKLQNHYMTKHKVCAICNYKCHKASTLTNHINKDHIPELADALKQCAGDKTVFQCYLCSFSGLTEYDLREHRLRVHIKCQLNGMYQCPYLNCNNEDPIAYTISKHIETRHDKLKQTQCPLCNYSAATKYSLWKHIETHSKTMLKCPLCSFGSKTSFSLRIHMKRQHPINNLENITGMIYATDMTDGGANTSYNDDYRITLDSLLPNPNRATESQPTTSSSESNNVYEEQLPSFGEILCSQNLSEEPSDQEGDCTIVSDALTRRRGRSGKTAFKNTQSKKKSSGTRRDSGSIDDPDDCMIVLQEIPTVDLSDDEEVALTAEEISKEGPDIIEIDNQDDCFVISDDLPVTVGNFTQESTQKVDNTAALQPRIDSDTDTCSEVVVSPNVTNSHTASGSETDTCSLSASDILSCISGSENVQSTSISKKGPGNSQNITSPDKQIDPFADENEVSLKDIVAGAKILEELLTQKIRSDSFTEENVQDNVLVGNIDEVYISEPTQFSSDNNQINAQLNVSDPLELSKEPGLSDEMNTEKSQKKSNKVQIIDEIETLQATKSLLELLDDRSELETPQESQEVLIVPNFICPESVLIESSDEDSNECTYVSESNAVIGETSMEKNISDHNGSNANSVESQEQFGNNTSDNFSTDEEVCGLEKNNASETNNTSGCEGIGKSNNAVSSEHLMICDSDPKLTSDVELDETELLSTGSNSQPPERSHESSSSNKINADNLEEICSSENSQKTTDIDSSEIIATDIEMSDINNTSETIQNKIDKNKSIEESSFVESGLDKRVEEESVENLNIPSFEISEKATDVVVDSSEILGTDIDMEDIKTSETTLNKIDKNESIEENSFVESEGLDKRVEEESVGMSVDTQKTISDTILDGAQPVANTTDIIKDNFVQVACADSTVSDCVPENDNISEPAQNILDSREDACDKYTAVDSKNPFSSDAIESEVISEQLATQKHLDVEENVNTKCNTEPEAEECIKSVQNPTQVPTSEFVHVDSREKSISEGNNIISEVSELETSVNIDLGIETTQA